MHGIHAFGGLDFKFQRGSGIFKRVLNGLGSGVSTRLDGGLVLASNGSCSDAGPGFRGRAGRDRAGLRGRVGVTHRKRHVGALLAVQGHNAVTNTQNELLAGGPARHNYTNECA